MLSSLMVWTWDHSLESNSIPKVGHYHLLFNQRVVLWLLCFSSYSPMLWQRDIFIGLRFLQEICGQFLPLVMVGGDGCQDQLRHHLFIFMFIFLLKCS